VVQADLDAEIATVVVAERLQGQGPMDHLKCMRQHAVHAEVNVKFALKLQRHAFNNKFLSGDGQVSCFQCGASGVKTCHVCNGCCHVKWYLQVICSL
jgi:hypothetical protein